MRPRNLKGLSPIKGIGIFDIVNLGSNALYVDVGGDNNLSFKSYLLNPNERHLGGFARIHFVQNSHVEMRFSECWAPSVEPLAVVWVST